MYTKYNIHAQFKFSLPPFQPENFSSPKKHHILHPSLWCFLKEMVRMPEVPARNATSFHVCFFRGIRSSNQSAVCQKLLSLWQKCFSFENQAPITDKSPSLIHKRVRSDLATEQQPVNGCKRKETNTLLPKVSPSWRCLARLKTTSLYFPTASPSLSASWV